MMPRRRHRLRKRSDMNRAVIDDVGGWRGDVQDVDLRLAARSVQYSSEHAPGQVGQAHGMLLHKIISIRKEKPGIMRLT